MARQRFELIQRRYKRTLVAIYGGAIGRIGRLDELSDLLLGEFPMPEGSVAYRALATWVECSNARARGFASRKAAEGLRNG